MAEMLNYARQRAAEALKMTRQAILATNGPAGLQVGEFPCEAVGLEVYFLVPKTSDLLFNLEAASEVTVLAPGWQLTGKARALLPLELSDPLDLLQAPQAQWAVLVCIRPIRLQIYREEGWGSGWGSIETIDLSPP